MNHHVLTILTILLLHHAAHRGKAKHQKRGKLKKDRHQRRWSRRKELAKHHQDNILKKPTARDVVNLRLENRKGPLPEHYSRDRNAPKPGMTPKQIRYKQDILRHRQDIMIINNIPKSGYMSQEIQSKKLNPLIDLTLQRTMKHGTNTTRRRKKNAPRNPAIQNPIPLIVKWILHILYHKDLGLSFDLPDDYDFMDFDLLKADYVNAHILPVLHTILLLPTLDIYRHNEAPRTWPYGYFIEFLQKAFIRRLHDRRKEPKFMHPEDSDPEDNYDYDSDVDVLPLQLSDWDAIEYDKEQAMTDYNVADASDHSDISDYESDGDSDNESDGE